MVEYYKAEKLTERITVIKSLTGENLYLIIGDDKAVLIDTCIGIKGLKNVVESITDKPLTVLISHGHIDHAPGAPEFDNVYMNEKDIPLYQSMIDLEGRRGYAAIALGEEAFKLNEDEFVPETPDFKFINLMDGMSFNLGGVTVEAYEYPGHTKGCMVFLIPEERILICGDACNNSTFLFDEVCATVSEYEENTKKIAKRLEGKYDRIFLMHMIVDAPVSLFDEMIELCEDIKKGNVDNIPGDFMGNKYCMAKKCNQFRQRDDKKFANLLYNPNRIG